MPQPLPSIPFPAFHSLIIVSFAVILSEQLGTSLHNTQNINCFDL